MTDETPNVRFVLFVKEMRYKKITVCHVRESDDTNVLFVPLAE